MGIKFKRCMNITKKGKEILEKALGESGSEYKIITSLR